MTLRNLMAALAVTLGLVAPTAILAAPAAQADTPRCVSIGEFDNQLRGGQSKKRVTRIFDTAGREIARQRSGRGRLLDTIQKYRACGYRDDVLLVGFDDYTYGRRSRGGPLEAYGAQWDHYCVNYEDVYEYEGEWVYDPETGEETWVDDYYSWYSHSYCYDRGFKGEFYDESMEGMSENARARLAVDREPIITKKNGVLR